MTLVPNLLQKGDTVIMSNLEYESLRSKLIHSYTIVDSSRNILYITVAYILTFATNKNSPLLYLLPFAVILPIYLVAINYTFDMYRIATYIMVFGEGEFSDLKWETRQYALNKQPVSSMPRQAKTFHMPYVCLGLACQALFYLAFDYTSFSFYSLIILIIGIILLIILLCIFLYYHDMTLIQQKYIDGWMVVKLAECQKVHSDSTP